MTTPTNARGETFEVERAKSAQPQEYGQAKPAQHPPINSAGQPPYAPAPPYMGQPVYPPQPVQPYGAPASDGGFNIQWLLFILGWFFWIPSIVACFLPLCSRPRFPTKSHKYGWIANIILAVGTLVGFVIIFVVFYTSYTTAYTSASSTRYSSG